MSHRGRITVTAVTLLCALVAVTGPSALAGNGAKSRVNLKSLTSSGASGVVKSKKAKCKRGREVSLHRHESFFTEKIAITTTSANGRWSIDRNLSPGKYFAKVKAKKGCRYAVSRNVTLN